MRKFLKQLFCHHACDVGDLKRVTVVKDGIKIDGGAVEVSCLRCGKVFKADYGLMIDVQWVRRHK